MVMVNSTSFKKLVSKIRKLGKVRNDTLRKNYFLLLINAIYSKPRPWNRIEMRILRSTCATATACASAIGLQ